MNNSILGWSKKNKPHFFGALPLLKKWRALTLFHFY